MSRMVTGDHDSSPDPRAADDQAAEREDLGCTCRWQLMDTGSQFHTRIVWSDPHCLVHHPKR